MIQRAESDRIILRKVTPADLPAAAQYRLEFLRTGSSMDGCSNLRRFKDITEWYDWICSAEHPDTCPAGWMPDTQYISIRKSDGMLLGMADIRHELNEAALKFFGGIGYSIRPSQRGKGYATEQLGLALEICRSMGMDKLLVTCHKENAASAKVIQRNGGVLENEVVDDRNGEILQRYWIRL